MVNSSSYSGNKRLSNARTGEYPLVSGFKYGYRNKEDISTLPAEVLVVGSQNVLTTVNNRLQNRQGYTYDGDASVIEGGVLASFDWLTRGNGEVHMRAGGLTSAANDGKLQYRYVDSEDTVTWRDLTTSLTTVAYNFTTWWNSTESLRECLFVNGTSNIFRWNGATAIISSTTANTITKTGTDSWLDTGFYSTGNKSIVINGTVYTYTGGESTTTLTGVSGNPTGEANGSVVHQSVVTTANSAMTTITSTFTNGLIRTLNNQVFVGSLTSSVLWISKINSYTDYSSSTPRQVGEGSSLVLDDNLVGLDPQENFMYVTAGQDLWYNVSFELQTSTVGVTYEQVNALPLKTGRRQAAISQAFLSHMKNNIIVVTKETTIDTFGRIETSLATPQTTNISDSIKLDIDAYDFTNGSIFYHQYAIYVAIPAEGVIRIFKIDDKYWEAPQTMPISRFYVVDGVLYGHSYLTLESYKLFDGYNDVGNPINSIAAFPYMSTKGGSPTEKKNFNKIYTEGYIASNTELLLTVNYDFGGYTSSYNAEISGANQAIIFNRITDGSIGQNTLGSQPVGTILNLGAGSDVPKFRIINTMPKQNMFEYQIVYSSNDIDINWQLLRFAPAVSTSTDIPVEITI